MRPRAFLRIFLAFLFAGACSGPFPVEILELGGVQVRADDDGLSLANGTDRVVYYFVLDVEVAETIEWYPCSDLATCPRLAPGARTSIRWERTASNASRRVYVSWWHLVPGPPPGGTVPFRPDSVRRGIIGAP